MGNVLDLQCLRVLWRLMESFRYYVRWSPHQWKFWSQNIVSVKRVSLCRWERHSECVHVCLLQLVHQVNQGFSSVKGWHLCLRSCCFYLLIYVIGGTAWLLESRKTGRKYMWTSNATVDKFYRRVFGSCRLVSNLHSVFLCTFQTKVRTLNDAGWEEKTWNTYCWPVFLKEELHVQIRNDIFNCRIRW